MARDSAVTISYVWANDSGAIKGQPSFIRNEGWPEIYQKDIDTEGGLAPAMSTFNQLFYDTTNFAYDVNRYGGNLPWDSSITYEPSALVVGSDNNRYVASQQNIGVDPVSVTTDWDKIVDVIEDDGVFKLKSGLNNIYSGLANIVPYLFQASNVLNIDSSFGSRFVYLNAQQHTINLSSGVPDGFNFTFAAQTSIDVVVTLNAASGGYIDLHGSTLQQQVITFAKGCSSKATLLSHDGSNWILSGVFKAEEENAGAISESRVKEIFASYEMEILDRTYPVTSKFFSDSPLMVTNPDQIVPGWGTFTWVPLGGAGERFAHTIASPASLQGTGVLGSTDIISGSVAGTSITAGQLPSHHLYTVVDTNVSQPPDTFVDISSGVSITRSVFLTGGASESYHFRAKTGGPSIPTISPTSSVGNNEQHFHGLSIKSYVDYCYRRTA